MEKKSSFCHRILRAITFLFSDAHFTHSLLSYRESKKKGLRNSISRIPKTRCSSSLIIIYTFCCMECYEIN